MKLPGLPHIGKFLICQLAFISMGACAAPEILTFEYPPFIIDKNNAQAGGYGPDVYRAATSGTHLAGKIIIKPLARAKSEMAKGIYHVGIGSRNHHLPGVAAGKIIPIQIGSIKFHFFYLKKKFPTSPPDFSNIEQYRAHTICGQNQSAVAPIFAKHKLAYDAANALPLVFRKVAAGRCDLGFSSDIAFADFVHNNASGSQFAMGNYLIHDVFVDILVHADHPDAQNIVRDLKTSVDRLKKNGTLQKLAEKNFGAKAVPEYFLSF